MSRGWSVCREAFVDGDAGGGFVDEGLLGSEGGDERLQGEVVERAGYSASGGVDHVDGVVADSVPTSAPR